MKARTSGKTILPLEECDMHSTPAYIKPSDTPRTDAIVEADWHMPPGWKNRLIEHARQLERELAAMTTLNREHVRQLADTLPQPRGGDWP